MIHDKSWFEMADKAKARLDVSSWISLFSKEKVDHLRYRQPGYWEEYFGAVAIMLPAESASAVSNIQWSDFRLSNRPKVEDDYVPAGVYRCWRSDLVGQYLVLRTSYETGDNQQVLIDPDLVLALRLILKQAYPLWLKS